MDLSGKIIGNYQIVDELGRGGMAVVYRAYQPSLNRYVAIKVLPPQLGFDQQFVKRFQREARAAAGLRHPNIVVIHDVGEQDGVYYIVMEYLEGYTLRQSIEEEGPLHLARAAHIVSQVAAALDYAHQQGFVHRDIKPSNIFIGKDDHVTLTDFGIARAASETQQLTRTGMLMGTPEYMSPEQAEGSAVDHRTDLYALGVVLYQMLVGRVPFSGTTPHATLHAVIYEPPPPPRQLNPGIPPAVEAVIVKAIAKQPQQRFQSGAELTSALRSAYSGQPSVGPVPSQPATLRTASAPPAIPTQRRSPLVWILAALAAILAVLLVVFVLLILNRGDVAQTPLPPPTHVIVLTTPTVNAGSATPSFVPTEVPLATATTSPTEPPTMPTNTPVLPTETPVPPTDTSEPPTDTPNPPTDTPTATMTPSPTPTTPAPPCAFPAQGVFATLWQTYRPELGCPLYQNPQLIQDAEQAFDNGHMFWRQDNDYAYVVYEKGGLSGSYQAFVDLWSEGDPEFSCAATPPAGKVQPVRGFGAVWCMLGGPGAATGWGLAEETGFGPGYGDPMVQDFERGFILRDSDGTTKGLVYIFFNDGMRFVRVSY
jgi:serine/threonine protein kinase